MPRPHRSLALAWPVFAFATVAVASCAGAPPPAPRASTPAAIPTFARPHDLAWATWTHEQKLAYMKEAVLPTEAPLFREYDPKRFAELTCRSCHGAGVDDGTYAMPNPALPKVTPGKIYDMEKTNPRVFRFMQDVLVPRTAALLGMPEWSHKTMSGFGCFNCHPNALKDAAKPAP